MSDQTYISQSAKDTQKIGFDLAEKLKPSGAVIALTGELGSGKTTFTQGFARRLGIKDKVISPTFVLIRQHNFKTGRVLFHVDLYRLEGNFDIKSLGLSDIFSHKMDICLIEWAEKIKASLPPGVIWINIEKLSQDKRKITINL